MQKGLDLRDLDCSFFFMDLEFNGLVRGTAHDTSGSIALPCHITAQKQGCSDYMLHSLVPHLLKMRLVVKVGFSSSQEVVW